MAGRIQGITVEIGGDTTKLSKALQGVKKDIKSTQTQLKDVEKLLKLDPSNTEVKPCTFVHSYFRQGLFRKKNLQ